MAVKTVVTCDVCYTEKKDVNHWFSVWIESLTFNTRPGVLYQDDDTVKHVCGTAHALTLYNRFLSNGTLDVDVLPLAINAPRSVSKLDFPVVIPAELDFPF